MLIQKYIRISMKLLTPINIFNKTVYFVGKNETVLEISQKFKTTPQFIILDNSLKKEPKHGDALIIISRGESFMLTDEYLRTKSKNEIERLKLKNKVDNLFIGQIIIE